MGDLQAHGAGFLSSAAAAGWPPRVDLGLPEALSTEAVAAHRWGGAQRFRTV